MRTICRGATLVALIVLGNASEGTAVKPANEILATTTASTSQYRANAARKARIAAIKKAVQARVAKLRKGTQNASQRSSPMKSCACVSNTSSKAKAGQCTQSTATTCLSKGSTCSWISRNRDQLSRQLCLGQSNEAINRKFQNRIQGLLSLATQQKAMQVTEQNRSGRTITDPVAGGDDASTSKAEKEAKAKARARARALAVKALRIKKMKLDRSRYLAARRRQKTQYNRNLSSYAIKIVKARNKFQEAVNLMKFRQNRKNKKQEKLYAVNQRKLGKQIKAVSVAKRREMRTYWRLKAKAKAEKLERKKYASNHSRNRVLVAVDRRKKFTKAIKHQKNKMKKEKKKYFKLRRASGKAYRAYRKGRSGSNSQQALWRYYASKKAVTQQRFKLKQMRREMATLTNGLSKALVVLRKLSAEFQKAYGANAAAMLDQQQREARKKKYAKTTNSLKKATKVIAKIRAMGGNVKNLQRQRIMTWRKMKAKRRANWKAQKAKLPKPQRALVKKFKLMIQKEYFLVQKDLLIQSPQAWKVHQDTAANCQKDTACRNQKATDAKQEKADPVAYYAKKCRLNTECRKYFLKKYDAYMDWAVKKSRKATKKQFKYYNDKNKRECKKINSLIKRKVKVKLTWIKRMTCKNLNPYLRKCFKQKCSKHRLAKKDPLCNCSMRYKACASSYVCTRLSSKYFYYVMKYLLSYQHSKDYLDLRAQFTRKRR